MATQGKNFREFINACLQKRVPPEQFRVLLSTFQTGHPLLHRQTLLDALVKRTEPGNVRDPRVLQYVRELLRMKAVSLADVLSSLLPPPLEPPSNGQNAYYDQMMLDIGNAQQPTSEALVFRVLIVEVSEGLLTSNHEVKAALKALIPWMSLFSGSTTLGYLVLAILGTTITQELFGQASMRGSVVRRQKQVAKNADVLS